MNRTIALLLCSPLIYAAGLQFREHTIATELKGGYQVVAVDVNHDGKPDLIALASGMPDLVWYENPTWERHVIASNLSHMINLAADTDGDGIPEILLAYEFANVAKTSVGKLCVLHHNGDPRELWSMREIDRIPTSHRIRAADIDGSGKKVFVNGVLAGPHAEAPDYKDHVPLVLYRPGEWKRELISAANEGVVHGIYVLDWDGDGRDEILTASFVGIHLYKLGRDGQWSRTELTKGDPAPWPKSGASDVAVGKTGNNRFLAAIEPWHGNQVVVYRKKGSTWDREVLEDKLNQGHTIATGDLAGDGNDEIIAGFRGKPYRVDIYRFAGKKWSRETLDDGGMAASSCVVADLNEDGKPDITCIGSATQNLKWYENVSKQ